MQWRHRSTNKPLGCFVESSTLTLLLPSYTVSSHVCSITSCISVCHARTMYSWPGRVVPTMEHLFAKQEKLAIHCPRLLRLLLETVQSCSRKMSRSTYCTCFLSSGASIPVPCIIRGSSIISPGLIQVIQNRLQCGMLEGPRCRLEEGLQLWKARWDATILQMSPSQLETSGFCKDAGPDFWHLACYLLTTGAGTASSGSEDTSCSTSEGTDVFRELLQSAKSL
jgi:hypothetical protein